MSKDKRERPLAYPRPTETDIQHNTQPEYIDNQPNDMSDRSVSGTPDTGGADRTVNDPSEES